MLMQTSLLQKIYVCADCDKEKQKKRGCKRPKRNPVVWPECVCGGNKDCEICKGKNQFSLKECPAKMKDASVNRFLPFFWHWRATGYAHFPDNAGRYYQPTKLLDAFALCSMVVNREERKEAEKARAK